MNATALVRAACAAGITMKIQGDRLVLLAKRRPEESLLAALRARKADILAYLHATPWTEEDWRALFDERAAIMEFDGGLTRVEAARAARDETEILRSTTLAAQ